MDFAILVTYAAVSMLWMLYLTDGSIEGIGLFIAGFSVAWLGVALCCALAKDDA